MADIKRPLEGKVAIVTGAGAWDDHQSIGRAEAVRLAEEGAKVIVNNRHSGPAGEPTAADNVVAEIRAAGGEAFANTDSVATFDGGRRIIEAALDHFGRIDILVNNAGFIRPNLIWDMTEEEFDDVVAVHLKGTFNTVRHVAPHFVKQKSGVIVNTGSNSGQGQYGNAGYAGAKEGVLGFTRSIARDLGPHGIRANTIRPGAMSKQGSDEKIPSLVQQAEVDYNFPTCGEIWMTRFFEADWRPVHIANFITWLCTDSAKAFNGLEFELHGAKIGVMAPSHVARSLFRAEGWRIEDLDDPANHGFLVGNEKNRFLPGA